MRKFRHGLQPKVLFKEEKTMKRQRFDAQLEVSSKVWVITAEVQRQIAQTIGTRCPEQGGILGSSDGERIDHYYFDSGARVTGSTYTFDDRTLNRVIRQWNRMGVRFIGVVHSHPEGYTRPSQGDLNIASQIIETMDVGGHLFTPIVQVDPELTGDIRIYPYSFEQKVVLKKQKVVLERAASEKNQRKYFDRVKSIFPPEIMKRKYVICIGVGGAREFLCELARTGVKHFAIFDDDRVEEPNIATQSVFVSEIGQPKAEAAAGELMQINPEIDVVPVTRRLDDSMTDEEFAAVTGIEDWPTEDVLLCGCTDNWKAQDRCGQLALKYGVAYLGAQVYERGLGSEIVFTYPGLTPSCPRCMLEGRYRRAMTGSEQVNGRSEGSSHDNTALLTALKTKFALQELLYANEQTPYFGKLGRYAKKNFIMTRHDDAFSELGVRLFDKLDAVSEEADMDLVVGAVALAQEPNADCPLCGGTGDLLRLRGAIRDTRYIAPCTEQSA